MLHFSENDKLAKVIHSNYTLLPVINRFGIRLGFKDKTIAEICAENQIDPNFFITIINTYSDPDYFPEKELLSFSPGLLVKYLKKTHEYYFSHLFPHVERLLSRLLDSCDTNCTDLQLIKTFYNKYKEELKRHLEEEEEYMFPYVLAINDAVKLKKTLPEKYKKHSIKSFEEDHNNVDQKIYDLKNIVIKYLEPSYNDNDCNAFLFAIFQFEKDLLDHARIEDKILVNKMVELEKQLNHG